MNAWFTPTRQKLGASFLLGSDHYYNLNQDWGQNNPTPQYAVSVFSSLEQLRLMGYPPTVFELPGGSPSDFPPFAPADARTCYWINLAMGMKGSNYYIFTGGPNVPGTGVTSDIYDFNAAIGPRNEIRPLYAVQKEFGLFLRRQSWLMEADAEYVWRVSMDSDMARAGDYGDQVAGAAVSPKDSWRFFQRGFLTTAFSAGLLPRCVDLDDREWLEGDATPVVVLTSSVMGRARQERVVEFLRRGGTALVMPVIPSLDENLAPCTVLARYLGGVRSVKHTAMRSRVSIAGVSNIHNNGAIYGLERLPASARRIGIDEISGKPLAAAWTIPSGGRVLAVGFRWSHANHEHTRMLAQLAGDIGVRPCVSSSDPNVWATMRSAGARTLVFVMNLWSAPMSAHITCRPAGRRDSVDLGWVKLPPMHVRAIEVNQGRRSQNAATTSRCSPALRAEQGR
jgi:hypothetical protein